MEDHKDLGPSFFKIRIGTQCGGGSCLRGSGPWGILVKGMGTGPGNPDRPKKKVRRRGKRKDFSRQCGGRGSKGEPGKKRVGGAGEGKNPWKIREMKKSQGVLEKITSNEGNVKIKG